MLKNIDKSSPKLIEALATGKLIPRATLTFRSTGELQVEYYVVALEDVLVTAVDQTDQPDPSKIVERVQLNPAKFAFTYREQRSSGRIVGETKFGYDCVKNTSF